VILTDAVFGFRFDLRHGSNAEDIGRSLFDFDFVRFGSGCRRVVG
jgi:hypothetical protein